MVFLLLALYKSSTEHVHFIFSQTLPRGKHINCDQLRAALSEFSQVEPERLPLFSLHSTVQTHSYLK